MTFDDWLAEGEIMTRMERMNYFMTLPDTPHKREMMLAWLMGAWNAGAESGISIPRDAAGRRIEQPSSASLDD